MDLKLGVWSFMQYLKIDELISTKTSRNSVLRKTIPRSRAYKHEKFEYPVSPDLKILIDRGDYTQWRVFAGKLFINPRIFAHLTINPDSFSMIDIGANIGAFTILFAPEVKTKEYNVHLFEPNPGIVPTLQENIKRLQAVNPAVKPFVNTFAVGEKESVLTLKIDAEHSGLATLGVTESYHETVDVNVIPLDQYITEQGIARVDFIKIDVESFEPSVFNGARKVLARFKPVLYFEYSVEWFDNFDDAYIEDLIRYFLAQGYRFYRESREGDLVDLPMSVPDLKRYRHLNILGVSK